MYGWEKSMRENRVRNNPPNPSFSSTLLDQIYHSIDGGGSGGEKSGDLKHQHKERVSKKQSGGRVKATSSVEDEEAASLRRACLIEKWMDMKVKEKASLSKQQQRQQQRKQSSMPELDGRSLHYNDPLFFSSSSTSSDSSSGRLSSSEAEFWGATKSRTSCFAAPRPKPVKTKVSAHSINVAPQGYKSSEGYMFDEFSHRTNVAEEGMIKSKARALKIYASLKKVKHPISPGGRLSSFINSLFTNGNAKKSQNSNPNLGFVHGSVERKVESTQASTCSSASSFSRSCLSKNSPNSREKLRNGVKRTVRFYPVSVIVDEDSRPCGHKRIQDEDSDKFGRIWMSQRNEDPKLRAVGMNYKAADVLRTCQDQRMINADHFYADDDEDDYDDAGSDASSDLFELDHLKMLKNERFCEELPVYETTYLERNRAIASGLIR